jgi:hypothetical protein
VSERDSMHLHQYNSNPECLVRVFTILHKRLAALDRANAHTRQALDLISELSHGICNSGILVQNGVAEKLLAEYDSTILGMLDDFDSDCSDAFLADFLAFVMSNCSRPQFAQVRRMDCVFVCACVRVCMHVWTFLYYVCMHVF